MRIAGSSTWFFLTFFTSACSHMCHLNENYKIGEVIIHSPFSSAFTCSEHWHGQFTWVGDALGTDCQVVKFLKINGRSWRRSYNNNGLANEDWYSWNAEILAPFDGVIEETRSNPKTNRPGKTGEGLASSVTFLRSDGVRVLFAHIQSLKVKKGDYVTAGEPVAKVGNNGQAWHPHLHIGAWKNEEPLQIRFDLISMSKYEKGTPKIK